MVGEGSGAGLTDAEVMLGAVTDRAIVMPDSDGGIIRWSAGAQALLGYSDQEVTGKPISIFHSADDRGRRPGHPGTRPGPRTSPRRVRGLAGTQGRPSFPGQCGGERGAG